MNAGEIRIATKIDNSGISGGVKKTEKEIGRLTTAFERETGSIKNQEIALRDLKRRYDEIAKGNKQTTSVTAIENQFKRASKSLEELQAQYKKLANSIDAKTLDVNLAISQGDTQGAAIAEREYQSLVDKAEALVLPLNKAKTEAARLKSELDQLKMDPKTTVEAQKLANQIGVAEGKLDSTKDKANNLRTAIGNAYDSLQGIGDFTPFEESVNFTQRAVESVNASIQQEQRELQNLIALYEQAEAAIQDAKESGDEAAQALAQSNMDKILSDVDRVKVNVENLSYDANKLSENFNDITLDPQNATEAAKMRAQISGITFMLEDAKDESKSLNEELHDAFSFDPDPLPEKIDKTGKNAKSAAGRVRKLSKETKSAGRTAKNSAGMFERLGNRIRRIAVAAFVFNLVRRALSNLSQNLMSVLKQNTSFANSLNNIKANLLTAFAPIYNFVLPALLNFMQVLERVTYVVARFIASLFGQSYNQAKDAASSLYDQAEATDELANATKKAEKQLAGFDKINKLSGTSDNTGALNKEDNGLNFNFDPDSSYWEKFLGFLELFSDVIEEIKRSFENLRKLIGKIGRDFKKVWNDGTGLAMAKNLNQIFTNILRVVGELALRIQEAWDSNDNGVLIWQAVLGLINDILNAINKMSAATVTWAQNLNLGPLMGGIVNLAQAFRELAGIVIDALGWAYINILLPIAKWLLELFVPKALDLLAAAFSAISDVLEALKPLAIWLWEEFLKPLGAWAGEAVISLIEWLTDALTNFSNWASKNQQAIRTMAELVLGFLAGLWVYNTSKKIIIFIQDLIKAFIKFGGISGMLKALGTAITSPALAIGLLTAAVIYWASNWDTIKNSFDNMSSWQKAIVIILGVAAAVAVLIIAVTAGIGAAGILAGLALLGLGAMIKWAGSNQPIGGAGGTQSFSSGTTSTAGATHSANSALSGLSIGGYSLPKLAQGAVLPPNQPFAAIVGDQRRGTNIEAPMDTIKQGVREVLAESHTTRNGNQTIIMEIDGKQFARVTLPYTEQEQKRVGLRMSST